MDLTHLGLIPVYTYRNIAVDKHDPWKKCDYFLVMPAPKRILAKTGELRQEYEKEMNKVTVNTVVQCNSK